MTPLERAARALARRSCPPGGEAHFPYVSVDEWEEKNWRDHIPAACAVLLAIREPSEVMIDEAYESYDADGGSLRKVFSNMIDAALKEG